MKKILAQIALLFTIQILNAQTSPPGIPYQAIARNSAGEPISNAFLQARFSLHEQSSTGSVSYSESHELTTDNFGLFATTIGSGTALSGAFNNINWSETTKFLQVEIDLGQGWIDMGTQQLMSVPFALYSAQSASIQPSQGMRVGFSSSGDWVCPPDVYHITVELWGAGGGAGGTSYAGGNGHGNIGCPGGGVWYPGYGGNGGNGGYLKATLDVVPGQTYPIIIGIGGLGGQGGTVNSINGMNGQSGGSSQFASQIAVGGTGGTGGAAGNLTCTNGQSGNNAAIVNYQYPQMAASRGYIPSGYLAYPSPSAEGGNFGLFYTASNFGFYNGQQGGAGENGFCIITY